MSIIFPQHEGIVLEYKEAADSLPKTFFETVCAFFNRDGGLVVLGIADKGVVSGVNPEAVGRIMADIANLSNNPQKLDPPYLLFPQKETIDGKQIIRVQVPCSSQVHRCNGEVFLRNEDGDYRLRDPYQIAGLVNRKLSFYTEQRVIPWLGMAAPAILTIFSDRVVFSNPHVPHKLGPIDPANFTPFPKNPVICNFMLQMGRYEQAGSGVYNVSKYLPHYTPGAAPLFEELSDRFSATIPVPGNGTSPEVTPEVTCLLKVLDGEMSRREIMGKLGLADEKHFRKQYQQRAVKTGLIELTIPEKPTSRLQKYQLTRLGRTLVEKDRKS